MLNITDEQKALFNESGHFPGYIFTFSDINLTITNDTIHDQAVTVKESIMDANELTLGGCISSSIEFEVSEIMANDITGHEFTARLEVTDSDGNVELSDLPMGTYTPTTVQQVDDKDYKKVTAYDRLTRATADVSEWYNTWFGDGDTHTVKETRESLLTYLNIPYVVQNLTNDTYVCEKTVESANMIGLDILKMLCTINGGFGRMNRSGQFEVITLSEITGSEPDTSEDYRTMKYEEYTAEAVTGIIVKGTSDDVGINVGDKDTNPYVIAGNIFLYNNNTDDQKTAIRTVAKNILNLIKDITYRPHTSNIDGLPYMECGDTFNIEKENDTLESYIFSRTLSGVAYLQDQYEAKGIQERKNEVSATSEMYRNAGKQFVFVTSVDGLKAELTNFETETTTSLELMDGQIASKISTEEMESSIEQTADEIKSTVSSTSGKYREKEFKESVVEEITRVLSDTDGRIVEITACNDENFPRLIVVTENAVIYTSDTDVETWENRSNLYEELSHVSAACYGNGIYAVAGQKVSNGLSSIYYCTEMKSGESVEWKLARSFVGQYYSNSILEMVYGNRGFSLITGSSSQYVSENLSDVQFVTKWATIYETTQRHKYYDGKYLIGSGVLFGIYDGQYYTSSVVDDREDVSRYMIDISYGNGVYVAIGTKYISSTIDGNGGDVYISTDLQTWERLEEMSVVDTSDVPWRTEFNEKENIFIIISSCGKVYTSDNGKSWKLSDKSVTVTSPYVMMSMINMNEYSFYTSDNNVYAVHLTGGGGGYTISLHGYGNPTGNDYYTKSENIGKYYLDEEKGYVYLLGDDLSWTKIDELLSISSEVSQNASTIVMKVEQSTGKVVQVELSADPSEGTEYKVSADNIDFFAENMMQFTAKNIGIEADNFILTPDGKVTAYELLIKGGEIEIESFNSESVINITGVSGLENVYLDYAGLPQKEHPDYGGEGVPDSGLGNNNEFYYDILSKSVYIKLSDNWKKIPENFFTVENSENIFISNCALESGGGFSVSSYFYLDRDGNFIKQETSIRQNIGGIEWKINVKAGGTADNYITKTAKMGVEVDHFIGNFYEDYVHRIYLDSALKIPKLEIGDGWEEETEAGAVISHYSPNFTSDNGGVSLNDSSGISLPPVNTTEVTTTSLTVNGKRQVFASEVFEIVDNMIETFWISAPGIDNTMPAYVMNGDGETVTGIPITIIEILPTKEQIKCNVGFGSYRGYIRLNYSYWITV